MGVSAVFGVVGVAVREANSSSFEGVAVCGVWVVVAVAVISNVLVGVAVGAGIKWPLMLNTYELKALS